MLLILVMLTTTGLIDSYTVNITKYIGASSEFYSRIVTVIFEILLVVFWSWKIFDKYEIQLWLKKSYQLFLMIFPKVLAGIFVCGIISNNIKLSNYINYFETNSFSANAISSLLGALMYFGTIVGVTIVKTLRDFGMNAGPALTLLLSGPAVSLPSIIALIPIVGKKKAVVFLLFVMLFSALCGFVFGNFCISTEQIN